MELGYVKAVKETIKFGMSDDLYGVWMFGSVSYKHTPRSSYYANKERNTDMRDYVVMRGKMR